MSMCERFQGIILTDYIDGEIAPEIRNTVDAHLLTCLNCRTFSQNVKNNLVMPFQKAARAPVPAELWVSIKEKIEEEKRDPVSEFIGRIVESLRLPTLAPAFAGLVVIFLIGLTVFHGRSNTPINEKEQSAYLVSLLNSTDVLESDNDNLGTPIEQYFL